MKIIKNNPKGKTYQTDNFKILYRNKNIVIGDNSENEEELIYLINGSIKLTINGKTKIIKSPAEIKIPKKTFHKLKTLTKVTLILF